MEDIDQITKEDIKEWFITIFAGMFTAFFIFFLMIHTILLH